MAPAHFHIGIRFFADASPPFRRRKTIFAKEYEAFFPKHSRPSYFEYRQLPCSDFRISCTHNTKTFCTELPKLTRQKWLTGYLYNRRFLFQLSRKWMKNTRKRIGNDFRRFILKLGISLNGEDICTCQSKFCSYSCGWTFRKIFRDGFYFCIWVVCVELTFGKCMK